MLYGRAGLVEDQGSIDQNDRSSSARKEMAPLTLSPARVEMGR